MFALDEVSLLHRRRVEKVEVYKMVDSHKYTHVHTRVHTHTLHGFPHLCCSDSYSAVRHPFGPRRP